jgi:hypothetical protein
MPVVVTLHDMNPFTGGCHLNRPVDRLLEHFQKRSALHDVLLRSPSAVRPRR